MPKTISIPASSSTRATSAFAGVSSVSIGSIGIALSSLFECGKACLAGSPKTTGLRMALVDISDSLLLGMLKSLAREHMQIVTDEVGSLSAAPDDPKREFPRT
jgi:hypothetical protein